MSNQLEKIKELIDRRAAARLGGGEKAIQKQHDKGIIQPVNVSPCCWTKVASKKWTCSWNTVVPTSAWTRNIMPATAW